MEKSPLFTIIIPTRNRGHLLPFALKSALNQNFSDYEILIVANNCTDNTKNVVACFDDPKIKYYETDSTLSMPENWEFAWTKARGDYITYLPDDDAMVPSALALVAEQINNDKLEIISWEDAIYYYPSWHDERLQNTLLLFNFGNILTENIATELYRHQLSTFSFAWSSPLPKLLNCFAHKKTFDRWCNHTGKLFFPVAPDYSFAWISSHICESVKVIHRPLTVRGVSDFSIGSNAGLGEATKSFIKEFGNFDFFDVTKLDIPVSYNHLAATFLRVNPALEKMGYSPDPINWEIFFLKVAEQLNDGKHMIQNWQFYCDLLITHAKQKSSILNKRINDILALEKTTHTPLESLRAMRVRTAQMANSYAGHMQNMTRLHSNDSECARCVLALNKEVLAESNWSYLYIFGEEINAYNPFDVSLSIDKYYNLLTKCKNKKLSESI